MESERESVCARERERASDRERVRARERERESERESVYARDKGREREKECVCARDREDLDVGHGARHKALRLLHQPEPRACQKLTTSLADYSKVDWSSQLAVPAPACQKLTTDLVSGLSTS